jgi:hypothetical protein
LPAIGAQAALVGVGIGGLTQSPPVAGTVMGLLWFGASNLLPTFSSFFRHELRLPASTGEERGHPRHVGAVDDLELATARSPGRFAVLRRDSAEV